MAFKIQTLNKISSQGLENFPRDNYEIASEINPDAILLRSLICTKWKYLNL